MSFMCYAEWVLWFFFFLQRKKNKRKKISFLFFKTWKKKFKFCSFKSRFVCLSFFLSLKPWCSFSINTFYINGSKLFSYWDKVVRCLDLLCIHSMLYVYVYICWSWDNFDFLLLLFFLKTWKFSFFLFSFLYIWKMCLEPLCCIVGVSTYKFIFILVSRLS